MYILYSFKVYLWNYTVITKNSSRSEILISSLTKSAYIVFFLILHVKLHRVYYCCYRKFKPRVIVVKSEISSYHFKFTRKITSSMLPSLQKIQTKDHSSKEWELIISFQFLYVKLRTLTTVITENSYPESR